MSIDVACGDERRRAEVRAKHVNGLDLITVGDDPTHLTVTLFRKAPRHLRPANFRIDGGVRVTGIVVTSVRVEREDDPELPDELHLKVNRFGDPSTYTLSIVEPGPHGKPGTKPRHGFDPRYASIQFTFTQNCPADLDCTPVPCPPRTFPEPNIDYLAKDYASFRQLLLDRLSLIAPDWAERHAADLGITLVELLAYAGDQLSYYQDAVATEAYLNTARNRISVRRHARLVDYRMHDGVNARTWVTIAVDQAVILPAGMFRFAAIPFDSPLGPATVLHEADVAGTNYPIFEPMVRADTPLLPAHAEIRLWTWGNLDCCLPAGATAAALRDEYVDGSRALDLRRGDVLIFEEVIGPATGNPADADPAHRQAVRLTSVRPGVDELYDQPIVDITWAQADALTFPLCLSTRELTDVSVARGNVVLVDHGASNTWCDGQPEMVVPPAPVTGTPITQAAPFPDPALTADGQAHYLVKLPGRVRHWLLELHHAVDNGHELTDAELAELTILFGEHHWTPHRIAEVYARFDELLAAKLDRLRHLIRRAHAGYMLDECIQWEITHTWGASYGAELAPTDPAFFGPAGQLAAVDPRTVLPVLAFTEDGDSGPQWTPVRDLLASGPDDRNFVGELDDTGLIQPRFGDGTYGEPPAPGATLRARYRIGNGTAGNVGAEAITRIALCGVGPVPVTGVRNPLPGVGGQDPEPVDTVRQLAPVAMRDVLLRAVTADDYATLAGQVAGVRVAAAELRWTGANYEAQVAVAPIGGEVADSALLDAVHDDLRQYRRIGHDLTVRTAPLVPLDIALRVEADPDHLAGHVRAALLAVFGTGLQPDGTPGFFNPVNLGFGTPVRVSQLVAAAAAVPGVRGVTVTRLQRLFAPPANELANGILRVGPLEIPQLDNDPDRPENGRLTLDIGGGR